MSPSLVPGEPRNHAASLVTASRAQMTSLSGSYRPQNRQNPKNRYNQQTSPVCLRPANGQP